MKYGDIYSKISENSLRKILGINNPFLLKLAKFYFAVFGYPDVASHGRFPIVMSMLKPKKNEGILDAGCGNGIYTNTIASYFGAKVCGCDIDRKRIAAARQIARSLNNKAEFICEEIEKIDLSLNTFDKIICLEVIEHIRDDDSLLKKFSALLKKQDILILSTAKKENLTKEEERKHFRKAKKGEHVRSGYELKSLNSKLETAGFKLLYWEPYYRFFSKIVIRAQQKIYKNKLQTLNLLTFPVFSLIAKVDFFLPKDIKWSNYFGWYRGYIIKAVKK